MEANAGSLKQPDPQSEGASFWKNTLFFFQGFISPCFSLKYYRDVTKKPFIFSVGFFAVFGLFIAAWTIASITLGMGSLTDEIRAAYEQDKIPTIIIEDGIAKVDGPQPLVYIEDRQFFGIDTQGTITEIDTQRYNQGLLLTRSEVHSLNENGYQKTRLSDLNALFGSPIVVNQENVLRWTRGILSFTFLLMFFGIFFGYTLFWFMVIVLFGLVMWGIVSINRKDVGFGQVMAVGLFAFVPVTYLDYAINKTGVQFCGIQMLLLVIIWGLVLWSLVNSLDTQPEEIAGQQ